MKQAPGRNWEDSTWAPRVLWLELKSRHWLPDSGWSGEALTYLASSTWGQRDPLALNTPDAIWMHLTKVTGLGHRKNSKGELPTYLLFRELHRKQANSSKSRGLHFLLESTYHFLWSRFLHGRNTLSLQILFNFLLIHWIHSDTPPQFLKLCANKTVVTVQ